MKRSILFLLVISLILSNPSYAQKAGLLKNVSNSISKEISGSPQESSNAKSSNQPEPKCACDPAELMVDLGSKLKLNYSEISISIRDDGALLLSDKVTGNFYIARDGVTEGPIAAGDKRLVGFEIKDNSNEDKDVWLTRFGQYISKSGEKYIIKFGGKTYGPYAQINSFVVPKSKDKFGAIVVENIAVTADQGKKMEEAIKNAKTDQERMELAMKYSQEMSNRMIQAGGQEGVLPKFISNVEGAKYDPGTGGTLNAEMKYDDIIIVGFYGNTDLKGNKVIAVKPEHNGNQIFVNTNNTKYAAYSYGSLTFSDGTTMSDLFNPRLVKTDGKIFLAYMYYSPKRNAIMQCKIPY